MDAAGLSYCKQNPVEYEQLPTHRLQMSWLELSVLVVGDQPFQQQAIHTLLRVFSKRHPSITFHVELVDTSQAAMELLQTRRDFHVVMLDVIMPDMR